MRMRTGYYLVILSQREYTFDITCKICTTFTLFSFISVGVPMVTTVTQFWAYHLVVSVVRAPVQTGPTVDATLLHLVTRTTVTGK